MAKKSNEKQLRELKKNHIWVPLVMFILVCGIVGWMSYFFVQSMIAITIDSKLATEQNMVAYMARLYGTDGGSTKYIDLNGRNYIVLDKSGDITASKGKNTCSFDGAEVYATVGKLKVYKDSEVNFFDYTDGENLQLDTFRFLKVLADSDSEYNKRLTEFLDEISAEDELEEDLAERIANGDTEELDRKIGDRVKKIAMDTVLYLPVWIEQPLEDGTRLVVQARISIGVSDVAYFAIFIGAIILLAFIIFIVLIINFVRTVSRNKKTMRIFFTDPVTKGHNRMWYLIKGEQYLRKSKAAKSEFAVVNLEFVDYGNYCLCHSIAEGEKMLCEIQERLDNRLGKEEISAHMNTSNFALLLKIYADEEALMECVEGIIRELEGIHTERAFHFQAGIETIGLKRNDKGNIVRRKDIDLELHYNNASAARSTLAKSDESGVAMFDDKLVEERRWVDTVSANQQSALDKEEFVVYYQPKYDPVTDELRGAEALIRWQSPEFGFIPPGRFIPIFETNGFITEIDHYMIRHVARDQKAWLDAGFKCVPVSVNVSRAHFIEADLAEQIRDMVDEAECPHEYIEIELTESAFFDDKNALIATINKLKSYGFAVSMDDFGSGYSSLNSLKDMPLDVLKLDAEFFRGENAGERGELVVSEAIKLAKSLKMRTVAEGVEEKSQVEFLAEQGCDMIQGYFYAKPMPGKDYEERMTAGKKSKEEVVSS
ncbi:MAG: EAL domain-containing protein [Lachnospiraceae bacterium]|nr:EAL domain-containing protein [Lachnospiraceae bacterium]